MQIFFEVILFSDDRFDRRIRESTEEPEGNWLSCSDPETKTGPAENLREEAAKAVDEDEESSEPA